MIEINTHQFRNALIAYAKTTKRSMPEILNQRALNIAGRAFDLIPPKSGSGVDAKRRQIRNYMNALLAQKVRQVKSGPNAGRFKKSGQSRDQLMRKHLIAQLRAKQRGEKGLYGNEMRKASARVSRVAQNSVGFLKSLFLPIIATLNPICKFKFPAHKTSNISRWPGSSGFGKVKIANGNSLESVLTVGANLKRPGNAVSIVTSALQRAVNDEAKEIEAHIRRKMAQEARRMGIEIKVAA